MKRFIAFVTFLIFPISLFSDAPPPWWEAETKMEAGGKLDLSKKEWFARAQQLTEGEQITLTSSYSPNGRMIVRREARARSRSPQSMIVWILDDDGDMDPNNPQGDKDSDCYIADYGGDGLADRMVDYIDADGDQVADEMEIRYFEKGELRRAWFGHDLDGDGSMWDATDYEYHGDFFRCDPYGDNEIYMNKYHPQKDAWLPISECPFSFYDSDGDGQSEIVTRFSAAPLDFSAAADPDYANSQARYQGEFDPAMEQMGVVNVRYSFDIDGLSSQENPLHYEMGFNMTGKLPYRFAGMKRYQSLRRAPKTSVCIPHGLARYVSETYPAEQTGFTWREFEDASIQIGHPSHPEYDRRWEGVFWTWNRRIMHNTGGPVQEWNSRREFMPSPSTRREIYYSPVDRRLHLKSAVEGWLRVGYIDEEKAWGEIRMFDADADGYFDRWEYYQKGEDAPYRIAIAPQAQNRDFADDWAAMQAFYVQQALPEAIRINQRLIGEIERLGGDWAPELPAFLANALRQNISPDERRYILDLIREFRYRHFLTEARKRSQRRLAEDQKPDTRSDTALREKSETVWSEAAAFSRLDAAYNLGDYDTAAALIREYSRFNKP
ncbi:MAG: hypothetical protein AB1656_21280 [Candidatus Omnitrophota bacterium]